MPFQPPIQRRRRPDSEPLVVILNGPAGVGKTTTARALAATVPNGACIHGDDLRDFIVTRRDDEVRKGLGYRNGGSLATNFIDAGYELVVFEYVFETARGLDEFQAGYRSQAPVHFFTLWAPLAVVERREASASRRAEREPLGPRLEGCHRRMEANLSGLGPVLDTAERPLAAVVSEILARCRRREGELAAVPGAGRALSLAS